MGPFETVTVERARPGITILRLNRPDRLNALDDTLISELPTALLECDDDPACRVVVLSGAGRGFCSGVDLTSGGALDGDPSASARLRLQQRVSGLVPLLRRLHYPVIAAVNGPAVGAGLALALAADIRVASHSAKFSAGFVNLGVSGCDIGVSYLLPRLIGASRGFELMLSGRTFGSDEADRVGLLTRRVPDEELLDTALQMADEVAANSPYGVWMTKQVMWSNLEVNSMQAAIDLEDRTQVLGLLTEDHREALAAFRERRRPRYIGR